jgi:hypothetical protein
MKNLVKLALVLNLGAAGIYAHERPFRATFSGTAGPSPVLLQYPNSVESEYNFAGTSALGAFTVRTYSASAASPEPPVTCSGQMQPYATVVGGGGVLRTEDGSLLTLTLTEGSDCIDLAVGEAHCIRVFNITGGTGRFKNASGTLTFNELLHPALADATGAPVFFSATGKIGGTISGVPRESFLGEQ